ncbi:MAG: 5-bromo-4-chloroindolyl phosphate hydrolysis family protein [Lachnospiraceae bacterium]|nr:5-bromo-4-chloroindolyl phosphate hydrolysis family protein [Lachnospiraceae bacterium]
MANWDSYTEEILDSVIRAIDTGDFTGLSRKVGDAINEAADAFKNPKTYEGMYQRYNTRVNERTDHYREKYVEKYANKYDKPFTNAYRKNLPQKTVAGLPVNQVYTRNVPGSVAAPLMIVFGALGMTGFSSMLVLGLIFQGIGAISIVGGALTAFFIAMMAAGAKRAGLNSRFARYKRVISEKGYAALTELASVVGKNTAFVADDLNKLIRKGYFLQAHLDNKGQNLIATNDLYKQYLETENERVKREYIEATERAATESLSPEVRRILEDGEAYIDHIHRKNEEIPGEEMTKKLSRLEEVVKRIFEEVKRNPSSANELGRFMDYYLPTTQKLIDAYADLEKNPSNGETVSGTRKEIEDTIDSLIDAFEKLFDKLFMDKAWDISSDISTMKTMMAQDGLFAADELHHS